MNEFLANEDLPSEAELLGANLASGDWNRGYQVSTLHTVWEASLGLKKVPYIGTVTVVKFMLKLIEIHQN